MSSPSTALGALEMSVIVSIFLLGVVTVQTLDYFARFPNDRLSLKLLIITLWALEMLHAGCVIYFLYFLTISTSACRPGSGAISVSIVLGLAAHACSNAALQASLTYRLFVISNRKLPLPATIWSLVLISFSLQTASLVFLVENRHYAWGVTLACSLLLNSLIYLVISSTIFVALRTSRKDKSKGTQRLIRRLMFWTFVNGLVFCVAGIVAGILFIVQSDNVLWVGSISVSQQFFSITFLSSINARKGMRNLAMSNEDPSGKPFSGLAFARDGPQVQSPHSVSPVDPAVGSPGSCHPLIGRHPQA